VRFMADLREPPSGGQQGRDFFRQRERGNQRSRDQGAKGGGAGLTGRLSSPYTLRVELSQLTSQWRARLASSLGGPLGYGPNLPVGVFRYGH